MAKKTSPLTRSRAPKPHKQIARRSELTQASSADHDHPECCLSDIDSFSNFFMMEGLQASRDVQLIDLVEVEMKQERTLFDELIAEF